jgi:hypothetical protein
VGKNNRDEASIISSDLFHGFLAIGTLGSEPTTSEPATPAFPVSLENMTEEKMKMTENDLKLVNNELVKFLEAEEEGCNDSLARRSYVSTITLSGMQMQATNAEDFGKTVACPLQGYTYLGHQLNIQKQDLEQRRKRFLLKRYFVQQKLRMKFLQKMKRKRRCKPRKHINLPNTSSRRYSQSFNLLQETLPLLLVMKLPILFLPRKNLIRCVFLQYFI